MTNSVDAKIHYHVESLKAQDQGIQRIIQGLVKRAESQEDQDQLLILQELSRHAQQHANALGRLGIAIEDGQHIRT